MHLRPGQMLARTVVRRPTILQQRAAALSRPSCSRGIFNRSKQPSVPLQPGQPSPIHQRFIRDAGYTLDFFKRFLQYSVFGFIAVSLTTLTVFEGAHQWVESVELAPELDLDAQKWQWNLEAERWTGGEQGGTDPALGFVGRHVLRGAWMAQNWGTGSSAGVIGSNAFTGRGDSGAAGLNATEVRLEYASEFLNAALREAEKRLPSDRLHPHSIPDIVARYADIMERIGTKGALFEARAGFERLWASQPERGVLAARIALKLGDLNRRLGERDEAIAWWTRSLQLLQGKTSSTDPPKVPLIPDTIPSEPLAQRTFVSLLVSLSAFYATTSQLRQAQALEEASLELIRSIPQPASLDTTSPAQALHALYILHRSSLLSIHLAEVLYALRKKPVASIEWLTRAAESAERVALTLTGLPPVHPDAPQSGIPHPPSSETELLPAYRKSVSMRKPARSLLRDSRRTAAEAWNLMGVLAEASDAPESKEQALEYYERALGWAGVAADGPAGIGRAGEGTLESEWKILWSNYIRAREAVLGQAKR